MRRGPTIEWNGGASRLKSSRGSDGIQRGGGKRSSVNGFSYGSRRRLLNVIGSILRDAVLPVFVTLTYPKAFPSANDAKRHLQMFIKRLRRAFPDAGLIWKLEPQERGAPHFHILIWGVTLGQLRAFVPMVWFAIAGNNDKYHLRWHQGKLGNEHCCGQVKSYRGVWFYAAKYIGKTFEIEGWRWAGRFWGIVRPESIPFGDLHKVRIGDKTLNDVIRYQRRFAGIRTWGRGATIYCDADQWVARLRDDEWISEGECQDARFADARTQSGSSIK
jgi:hypothetical protein